MWFRLQQQRQLHLQLHRHCKSLQLLRQSQSRSLSLSLSHCHRTMKMKMEMSLSLSLPSPLPSPLLRIRDKKENYCFIPFCSFATSNSAGDKDENDGFSDSYSRLLTRSTARQLKGDVPEAITLTNRALEILKSQSRLQLDDSDALQVELETADALVFLGKLHGLESTRDSSLESSLGSANAVNAVNALEEARTRYQQVLQKQDRQQQLHLQQTSWHETKRKELVGLSHLASAKARLCLQHQNKQGHSPTDTTRTRGRYSSSSSSSNIDTATTKSHPPSAEIEIEIDIEIIHDHFREALEGFSKGVSSSSTKVITTTTTANHNDKHNCHETTPRLGWKDGMTNHVAHEWSNFCASQGDFQTAREILIHAQDELETVFGETDPRVLQLNGRLAELLLLWKQQQEEQRDASADLDLEPSLSPTAAATTATISISSSTFSAEEDAMALLEMTLEKLPPNSPEARRIFMQLEDWKDSQEQQQQPPQEERGNNESESEP